MNWSGYNTKGEMAPSGNYTMSASYIRNGKLETAPVTTFAKVKSVSWDPVAQEMALEIGNGTTVAMSDVKRISI